MKEDERRKESGTYQKRNTKSVLVGKLEGRRTLRRTSRKWKNIIKINLPEILSEGLTIINLP